MKTIAGRYSLVERIGSGGMGEVFRAHDTKLGRPVAVKLLGEKASRRIDAEARFRREARIGAQLNHPNIVRIYDFGKEQDLLYLVMEFLQGEDLASYLSHSAPMSLPETIELTIQLSDAMHAAHQMQLVHRDIKPENIFLESTTPLCAKIVDFGMALSLDGPAEIQRLTEEGLVAGTPKYMAPEQLRGRTPESASDVYGLACVLFQILSGSPPYDGESLGDLAAHHLFAPVPKLSDSRPDVPLVIQELVSRCLAKSPSRRPSMVQIRDRMITWRDTQHRVAPISSASSPELSPAYDTSAESLGPDTEMRVFLMGDIPTSLEVAIAAAEMELIEEKDLKDGDAIVSLGQDPAALHPYHNRDLLLLSDTELGDMKRISDLLRIGVHDVVPRPVSPQELIRKLRKAFRSKHKRRSRPTL